MIYVCAYYQLKLVYWESVGEQTVANNPALFQALIISANYVELQNLF